MLQMVSAIKKYDPTYTDKVKLVVETLDAYFPESGRQVRHHEINRHLEFDCNGIVRLLCRRGYLVSEAGKGVQRTGEWPPPASFLDSGPIGFAYYLQKWFRYYLQVWISNSLSKLEAKEGVYRQSGREGRPCTSSSMTRFHSGAELLEVARGRLRKFVQLRQQLLSASELDDQLTRIQMDAFGQIL